MSELLNCKLLEMITNKENRTVLGHNLQDPERTFQPSNV